MIGRQLRARIFRAMLHTSDVPLGSFDFFIQAAFSTICIMVGLGLLWLNMCAFKCLSHLFFSIIFQILKMLRHG